MRNPLARLLIRSVAGAVSPAGNRARLSILIYHRVHGQADPLDSGNVTADEFEVEMRTLRECFTPLPLAEAVERLARGGLPARAACVTFDDGYSDNADLALPILKRLGVPATFFIATGYLDGGRMWNDTVVESIRKLAGSIAGLERWGLPAFEVRNDADRRDAIRLLLPSLKYRAPGEREACATYLAELAGLSPKSTLMLRSEQVKTLRSAGMGIGGHTATHPILANATPEVARREIAEGAQRLCDLLREPVRLFAYPNGVPGRDYTADHVRMVREAGFAAAFSTAWGTGSRGSDPLELPRFTPWDRTPGRFALRLVQNLVRRP